MDSIIVSEIEAAPLTPPSSSNHQRTNQAIPSTKRRKYSTKTPSHKGRDQTAQDHDPDAYSTASPSNEIRIFPLRAILDDRVKRRIRRNGLSEEMNTIYGERKRRAQQSIEEMTQLRDQLAAKEVENEMLRERSSLLQDTSRIEELEREISVLKQGVHNNHLHNDDWGMAAGDGFSDSGSLLEGDDQFFRDDTTVEVEDMSSPASAKLYSDATTALTPPNTSPTKPSTPENTRHFFQATYSNIGVQAEFADPDKALLEADLVTVRCELVSAQQALEAQRQLEMDLKTKLASAEVNNTLKVDPDHQLQMDIMLQTLADKTAAIATLNASLAPLGSPGLDSSHIITTLKDAFQSARRELEDMCVDGESLPATSEGAEILNNMLHRLKDSAAQVKHYECTLEAHCVREEKLRQQLSDREETMGMMSFKLRQKDNLIFKLEADKERSEAAVEGYLDSIADARRTIARKDAELRGMGENLESMISVVADLQAQLARVQVDREVDMTAREARYNEEIGRRDLQARQLQEDVTSLKEALTQAHNSVSQLQTDKSQLQEDADRQKKAARDTVASLRAQLLQSLQLSEAFLE